MEAPDIEAVRVLRSDVYASPDKAKASEDMLQDVPLSTARQALLEAVVPQVAAEFINACC